MKNSKSLFLCYALLFFVLSSVEAYGADRVTFLAGSFNRSVEYYELKEMADTGKSVGFLRSVFKIAKTDDKEFIKMLTEEHDVPFNNMSTLVGTPFGKAILRKIGKAIFPRRSRINGDKALSSAIILSIVDDDKLQLIEVIKNYPTDMGIDLMEAKNIGEELKLLK